MIIRSLAVVTVAGVCFAAEPSGPPVSRPATSVAPSDPIPSSDRLPTAEEFAALARTDPVALLEASVRRYTSEVRGFRAVLHKRERLAGTLHPPEVLRVAVRESPYAVLMLWTEGARAVRVGGISLGKVEGVLYAAGENNGNMLAWRPGAVFAAVAGVPPTGDQAKAASRYALTEAGLGAAADRTRRAWAAARDAGRLRFECLGTKPVAEVGGRVCHVLRRTCDPPELDPFLSTDPKPDAATDLADAFTTVTLMIDTENWLQVGSELRRADGELVGSYFFRDVELNPTFGPDEFKPAALRK